MKLRFVAVILPSILYFSAAAQNQSAETDFRKDMERASAKTETVQCRFTQRVSRAVLSSEAVSNGTLHFARPENLLLAFDNGDFIKMTPDYFSMKTGKNISKMKVSSIPALKELKNVLETGFDGNLSRMKSSFRHSVEKDEKFYTLTLSPSAKGKGKIFLKFLREDMSLAMLKMEQKNGDFMEYEFFDKTFNQPVDPKYFVND